MSLLMAWPANEMDTNTDVQYFNGVNVGSTSISASVPPNGSGKSWAAASNQAFVLPFDQDQHGKELFIGCWFYWNGSACAIYSLTGSRVSNDLAQIGLCVNNGKNIELYRRNALLATGTLVLNIGWYYIELNTLVSNSGFAKVYVNGNPTPDINFTGDTQDLTTDTVLSLNIGYPNSATFGGSGNLYYLPVVFDTLGTKNNGRVPSTLTCQILHPNSDGATIWTPSTGATANNLINSAQGAVDDATYVSTTTLNQKNVVNLTDMTGSGKITGIIEITRMEKSTLGTAGIKTGFISGANETQTNEKFLPNTFTNYIDVFEYETGTTDFTPTTINAMQTTAQLTTVG